METILIQILLNLISSGIIGTILVYFFQKKFTEQEHKFQIELEKEKNVIRENIKVIKDMWEKVITIDKNLRDAEGLCFCIKSSINRKYLVENEEKLKVYHHKIKESIKEHHHKAKEALESLNEISCNMSPLIDSELKREISSFLRYALHSDETLLVTIKIKFDETEFNILCSTIEKMKLHKKNIENRINEYIVPN